MKRHDAYAALTVLLCRACMQQHVKQFLIRYPAQAVGEETCQCRCGCMNAGELAPRQLGTTKRKHERKPSARATGRPATGGQLFPV